MKIETDAAVQFHEVEDTRERILGAAQKLFAERGFDATSVRDITTEADCNVASVNYHFGGKESLYLETFRSMLAVIRDRRLEGLGDQLERDPAPSLEEFVEAFAIGMLDPLVDHSQGRLFLDFVSREMIAPRLPHGVFLEEFIDPLMVRATEALEKFGPPLVPSTARMCLMSMVGQLLHALKTHHLLVDHGRYDLMPARLADYVDHFVRFSVGGIRACAERDGSGVSESSVLEVRQ
jgi:AcrR family transcriptional regulator